METTGRNETRWAVGSLAALLAGATAAVPGHADAYAIKMHEGNPVRWHAEQFELHVSTGAHPALHGVSLNRAVRQAIEAWQSLDELPHVVSMPDPQDRAPGYDPQAEANYNTIEVLDEWPYDPESLAVTVTSMNPDGEILDTDIFINGQNYTFTDALHGHADPEHFDLPSVLTHELGHAFGLDDSRDVPEATMWPFTKPADTSTRTIEDDDAQGAQALYLLPKMQSESPPAAQAAAMGCSAGATHEGAAWWWLPALLVALAWRSLPTRAGRSAGRMRRLALVAVVLVGCAPQVGSSPAPEADDDGSSAQASGWFEGKVTARRTQRRAGLLFTKLTLVNAEGRTLSVEVAGGELDGVVQHAFHQVVPRLGDALVAEVHKGALRGFRTTDDRQVVGKVLRGKLSNATQE